MIYILYAVIIVATFFFMEFMAWFTHKYIMHGFLWFLHKDHHQPEPGFLEKNDWFFVMFAIPSILLLLFGTIDANPWLFSVGLGILLYGIAYFLAHDVIVHQRLKWFTHSKNRYVRAIRWSHKMHHKHLEKENGESFGFLIIGKKYWDKIRRDDQLRKASKKN